MIILQGYVDKEGAKDFTRRMTQYPEAFYKATGEKLIPGTLNIAADKLTGWSFCTKASERVYITAEGCEIEFGATRGL